MTLNWRNYKIGEIIARIFDEQNFLKVFLIFLVPTVITSLLGLSLWAFLPITIREQDIPFIVIILLMVIIIILSIAILRVFSPTRFYLRLSFLFVVPIFITIFLTYLYMEFGENLFITLLIFPAGIVFMVLITAYTISSVQKPIFLHKQNIARAALGNLGIERQGLNIYGPAYQEIEDLFSSLVGNLSEILGTAHMTADHLAATAKELAASSEEARISAEEVLFIIKQINSGAKQQSEIADTTINRVTKMSKTIDDALTNVRETSDAIQDIARQTNILSLNAAIEAARAGEYGRGFAVVADNVRRLSGDSKESATNIGEITSNIVLNIEKYVTGIQESAQEIVSVASEFTNSTREISATVDEMATSVLEVAQYSHQLTKLGENLSEIISGFILGKPRIRSLFETLDDGYYETDLPGYFTYTNQSMSRILGYTNEELNGMRYKEYMDSMNAKAVFKAFNEVYETGIPKGLVGYDVISKDGTIKSVEVSASLRLGHEGKRIGFRGIMREIIKRRD